MEFAIAIELPWEIRDKLRAGGYELMADDPAGARVALDAAILTALTPDLLKRQLVGSGGVVYDNVAIREAKTADPPAPASSPAEPSPAPESEKRGPGRPSIMKKIREELRRLAKANNKLSPSMRAQADVEQHPRRSAQWSGRQPRRVACLSILRRAAPRWLMANNFGQRADRGGTPGFAPRPRAYGCRCAFADFREFSSRSQNPKQDRAWRAGVGVRGPHLGRNLDGATYDVARADGPGDQPSAAVLDSQSAESAEKGAVPTTKWVTMPASR
jgi:hypothetical protein